ncbi:expressed unknown protein [Seminavis robusta]|uniref:Uncharacterized protein n=1 Tax=Seminavis robusta TaxID=568900 RepID=A0A9N8DD12_9STRA|nr:expressed unknown protein [Seminavis robusta]|eukprot:Sro34_g021930.1 n/a (275) ;mRNA; r:58924-59816
MNVTKCLQAKNIKRLMVGGEVLLGEMPAGIFQPLARIPSTLEELHLSMLDITPSLCEEHLGEYMKHPSQRDHLGACTSLSKITIQASRFPNNQQTVVDMFSNVADGLKVNQTLEEFTMTLYCFSENAGLAVMNMFAEAAKHNRCLKTLKIDPWFRCPTGTGWDFVPLESCDAARLIEMYTKLNQNGLLGVLQREECNNAHLWAHALGLFLDDLDCSFALLQINPACLCQTGSQNERTQNGQTLTSDVDQFRDQDMEALPMANPVLRQIGSLNER